MFSEEVILSIDLSELPPLEMRRLGAAAVVLLLMLNSPVCGVEYIVTVDSAEVTGYVTHFWRSTGFWYVYPVYTYVAARVHSLPAYTSLRYNIAWTVNRTLVLCVN